MSGSEVSRSQQWSRQYLIPWGKPHPMPPLNEWNSSVMLNMQYWPPLQLENAVIFSSTKFFVHAFYRSCSLFNDHRLCVFLAAQSCKWRPSDLLILRPAATVRDHTPGRKSGKHQNRLNRLSCVQFCCSSPDCWEAPRLHRYQGQIPVLVFTLNLDAAFSGVDLNKWPLILSFIKMAVVLQDYSHKVFHYRSIVVIILWAYYHVNTLQSSLPKVRSKIVHYITFSYCGGKKF